MVGWHHRLNAHELEQAPGVGDGQGSVTCSSPCSHKELGVTELILITDYPLSISLARNLIAERGE